MTDRIARDESGALVNAAGDVDPATVATQVLISYARATEKDARTIGAALAAMGYKVWRDDALLAHRAFAEAIEKELRAAKAVVVLWSADAAASQWVRAEADLARKLGTLVQVRLDDTKPPLPFNQIHCADLRGWAGDTEALGWRTLAETVRALVDEGPPREAASPRSSPRVAPPSKPSVAVLPFANLTGEADDYFADGMLEEIVTALSKFQTLFVIASSSTLGYRGQDIDPATVMHDLGARYLLEGSVRRSSDRIRISVRLVDTVRGAQVWGERFDGGVDDVFVLQDQVAGSVAGALDSTIEAAEIRRAEARPTADGSAYDLFLKARASSRRSGQAPLVAAIELLDQALALDPHYAYAMVLAGYCHSSLYITGWTPDREGARQAALELCARALRQAGDDAQVLGYASGILVNLGEDLAEADRLAERGLQINPGSAMLLFWNAWIKAVSGDAELALSRFAEAERLDPRSPMRPYIQTGVGMALFTLRRFEAAAVALSEAVRTLPEYPTPRVLLIACHGHLGNLAEARESLQRLGSTGALAAAAMIMKRPGLRRELLREGLELAAAAGAADGP